ncbi:MAG: hypothetical protein FWD69_18525 [Polyangiaceae bacterium]|nr:hypothetical protein [Polyangiaceae bacterium]
MPKECTLPAELTLPSGQIVRLRAAEGAMARREDEHDSLLGSAIALLDEGAIAIIEKNTGEAIAPDALSLADFHVIAAVLAKAGAVEENEVEVECFNCAAMLRARPCEALEIAPWVDGELGDPELDATLPFGVAFEIPAIALDRFRTAKTVTLAQRTVGDARALFDGIDGERMSVSADVVHALGIEALGPVRDRGTIAKALRTCHDDAFAAIIDIWIDSHYPARLAAIAMCAVCNARNDIDAPFDREMNPTFFEGSLLPAPRETRRDDAHFPSLEAFMDRAHAIAEPLFAKISGDPIVLIVEGDTPAVDDGGSPLLGAYVPPPPAPTITVYYQSFRSENDIGDFDWDETLVETIEHELKHHIYFLQGADPMDDEEHAQIEADVRRVIGSREANRRAAAAFGQSMSDFLERTWILWIIVAVAFMLVFMAQR